MNVYKLVDNNIVPESDPILTQSIIEFYNQIMIYRLYLDSIDADGITFGEYRTNRIKMRKTLNHGKIQGVLVESFTPGEVYLLHDETRYDKYVLPGYNPQILYEKNNQRKSYVQPLIDKVEKRSSIVKFSSCHP